MFRVKVQRRCHQVLCVYMAIIFPKLLLSPMFVSKLPSNKNKWRPRDLSENTRVQLSAMSQTPPQLTPGSWRAIIIPGSNLSRMSPEPGHWHWCLPNSVPVTADTKAAVFTILVIFHYLIPLHLPLLALTMLFAEANETMRPEVSWRAGSDRCRVLTIHWSQDILRHFSRDLGNS